MIKLRLILLIFVISFAVQNHFAQEKAVKAGIVNARAVFLPKPVYTQQAKDFCAEGQVKVLIELLASGGKPLSAKAISGDELLKHSAEEAAMKAIFPSLPGLKEDFKTEGVLVFNFVPEDKCINVGIINKKAVELPKPTISNIVHPGHMKLNEVVIIEVILIIDENGKVTRAKALSGHPLLRPAFENAARKAKFPPTLINGRLPKIKGILAYKINPDGTVKTDF
jgi:outer membrane biosynthesis protein TonB